MVVYGTIDPKTRVHDMNVHELGLEQVALHFEMGTGTDVEPKLYHYSPKNDSFLNLENRMTWSQFNHLRYDKGVSLAEQNLYLSDQYLTNTRSQQDVANLLHRSIRSHERVIVHRHAEDSFENSTEYISINIREGALRLVADELPTLREFAIDEGIEYRKLEQVLKDNPEAASLQFYTSVTGGASRTAIQKRQDGKYQIKFDLEWLGQNLQAPAYITEPGKDRITITAEEATIRFFEDVLKMYKLPMETKWHLLYLIKHLDEFREVLYPL